MRKFTVMAISALLVVALTVPAWALETQFGGYWRTRAVSQQNFSGEDDTERQDLTRVDTRTRLYFTTIFSENLKFVNKFEYNSVWGDTVGGDIGADGNTLVIKNSYADFNLGPVNFKVGIQGMAISHGFLFDDDFSGAVVSYNGGNFSIPFIWMKAYEGGFGDANDQDVDYYGIAPVVKVGPVKINPYFLYAYTKEFFEDTNADGTGDSGWANVVGNPTKTGVWANEMNLWYAGLNLDASFDAASVWFTGIYEGGDIDVGPVVDFQAWLVALGVSVNLPFGDVHAQGFYATGDDGTDGTDYETFFVPRGQSHYWAEIMGLGIFDEQTSNNAPGDKIGNVKAANIGVTVKPMDKLKISLDVWYAALDEDVAYVDANGNAHEDDYLGTEVDLVVTVNLVQNLNLDIVGAYLFAGDATTVGQKDDADPYEFGTRLSLSF